MVKAVDGVTPVVFETTKSVTGDIFATVPDSSKEWISVEEIGSVTFKRHGLAPPVTVTVNDPSEPVVVVPVPDWHLTCTAPASMAVPVRATPEITKSELALDELLPPPPPHAVRVRREIESKNWRNLKMER